MQLHCSNYYEQKIKSNRIIDGGLTERVLEIQPRSDDLDYDKLSRISRHSHTHLLLNRALFLLKYHLCSFQCLYLEE
jgi:hypothetical protein